MELIPEAGAGPPTTELSVEVPAGIVEAPVGAVEVPPTLEEEKAGLLQFEVSNTLSRTPSISRCSRSSLPFFRR
jgi:hypothetical protein